jgi:hypothetical protein
MYDVWTHVRPVDACTTCGRIYVLQTYVRNYDVRTDVQLRTYMNAYCARVGTTDFLYEGKIWCKLKKHCTENSKQIFPKWNCAASFPISKFMCSHEDRNLEWGRAVSFLEYINRIFFAVHWLRKVYCRSQEKLNFSTEQMINLMVKNWSAINANQFAE